MELTLTGRNFTAAEAASWGLISRVSDDVLEDALGVAEAIASKSAIAVQAGKEAVNAAYETTLAQGLRYERLLFHGLFATSDQKEGACVGLLGCCAVSLIVCTRRYGCVRRETQANVEALVRRAGRLFLAVTTCTTPTAIDLNGSQGIASASD